MKIVRIGLDLAKNVLPVCGVDEHGKVAVRRRLHREQVLAWFAQVPVAVVGMEACSGAHDWARELVKLGHEARIMDSRFVAPYRRSGPAGKNADPQRSNAHECHVEKRYTLAAAKHLTLNTVALPPRERGLLQAVYSLYLHPVFCLQGPELRLNLRLAPAHGL